MQYFMRYKVARQGHRIHELTDAQTDQQAIEAADAFVRARKRAWAYVMLSNGARYQAWSTSDGKFFSQSELPLNRPDTPATKPAPCA